MKTKAIKVLSLLLGLSMLLSMLVVFSSCNNKTDENNNEETQEKQIVVVENAATSYKLVRADKASSMISGLVDRMKASIDSKFGCDMEHATDFVLAGETVDEDAPEILVGDTNRAQTADVLESLEPNSWAVVNKGNKIVICAANDALLVTAIDWFIDSYVSSAQMTLSIPESLAKTEGYGNELPLSVGGFSSYQIVYPNNQKDLEYCASIIQRHTKINGKELKAVSDNMPKTDYEIIIGASRRDEAKTYSKAGEFGISVEGTKIVIGGADATSIYYGVNYFLEYGVNRQDTVVSVAKDYSYTGTLEGYTKSGWNLMVPCSDVGVVAPAYNLGTGLANDLNADTVIDTYMHLVSNVKKAQFESYTKKLESFGFKRVYSATTDVNQLLGYRLGKAYVYVHFAPKQNYMRVIWDKSSNCEVSDFENVKEYDGNTVFYQYALDYTNEPLNFTGTGINCGMLYIIKLADNSLIMVDCGHTKQSSDASLQALYNFLYSITATPTDEPLRIKFWYYTHPDGDHTELTNKLYEYIKKKGLIMPEVETLGFNFPSERANDKLSKTPGSYEMIERMKANYPDINYIKLHTGMVFNIDEVKVETLGTTENIINTQGKLGANYSTNDTCTLLRFSFGGKSFLMTGDIGNDTSVQKYHLQMYSSGFLKSDVVQVSHHGYNKIYDIYDACDAKYALVSNSLGNAKNEVYYYFYKKITTNNIFFAGGYTHSMSVVDGEIKVHRLYRFDNPELRK